MLHAACHMPFAICYKHVVAQLIATAFWMLLLGYFAFVVAVSNIRYYVCECVFEDCTFERHILQRRNQPHDVTLSTHRALSLPPSSHRLHTDPTTADQLDSSVHQACTQSAN